MAKRWSLSPTMKAVLAVVLPATIGYLWSSFDSARKDALAYTSLQIEKLYGPLYGLTQASDRIWRAYLLEEGRNTPEQKEQWRTWIEEVFQPMNLRIEETILDNSQLIVGNVMPDVFRQAIANGESYKALIARWKEGKLEPLTTLVKYPDQPGNSIIVCVEDTYLALKQRQELLSHWQTRPSFLRPIEIPADCHGQETIPILDP